MVDATQLRRQIESLEDLITKVDDQEDNLDFLKEIDQDQDTGELRGQLESAKAQIRKNTMAIARRFKKLTKEDQEHFVMIIPDEMSEELTKVVSETETTREE